jgi:hypothetical protein
MAASIKIPVFWDIAPCSFVETDRRCRGAYYLLHHHRPHDGDGGNSFYQTTRSNIPEDILLLCTLETVSPGLIGIFVRSSQKPLLFQNYST